MMKEEQHLISQKHFSRGENIEIAEGIKEKLEEYYFQLKKEAGKEAADSFVLEMMKEIEKSGIISEEIEKPGIVSEKFGMIAGDEEQKENDGAGIIVAEGKKESKKTSFEEFKARIKKDKAKDRFINGRRKKEKKRRNNRRR